MWHDLCRAGRLFWNGLLDLVYPPSCVLCGVCPLEPHPELPNPPCSYFCRHCLPTLLQEPCQTCPRCAATIGPYALVEDGCSHCRSEAFAFDSACRLGRYEGDLRSLVLRIKHRSGEGIAELIGELFALAAQERLANYQAELIVPVPLHWTRRWTRGFNQSEALARGMAQRLKLPVVSSCIRRIRRTLPQASLSAERRRENVKGAFAAISSPILAGRTVLLVDEVMTTGATVQEAAKALRTGGASRVVIAVLTRTEGL